MSNYPRSEKKILSFDDAVFCRSSNLFVKLYRFKWLQSVIIYLSLSIEGGEFFSGTLRKILYRYHGICIGAYTYGSCMSPKSWPDGVSVGRYTSVGNNVKVFLRNHPMERLSLHPFFYNKKLGYIDSDNISSGSLRIGHDVWIGANVIFTGGCSKVGIGAVVGAGSIVTKDVPDFAVVAGNPARVLRTRFNEKTQKVIIESRWWENPVELCARHMQAMVGPLDEDSLNSHPLLKKIAINCNNNGKLGQ